MKDAGFTRPLSDPPPYSASSGPSQPYGANYGPYPGYPTTTQPTMSGVTVVTHPPTVIQGTTVMPIMVANSMGSDPAQIVCRSCQMQIITRVERIPSLRTHLFALLLCVVGCWPCACLPYCMDTCNNANHYCTNCNAYIGSYIG